MVATDGSKVVFIVSTETVAEVDFALMLLKLRPPWGAVKCLVVELEVCLRLIGCCVRVCHPTLDTTGGTYCWKTAKIASLSHLTGIRQIANSSSARWQTVVRPATPDGSGSSSTCIRQ